MQQLLPSKKKDPTKHYTNQSAVRTAGVDKYSAAESAAEISE